MGPGPTPVDGPTPPFTGEGSREGDLASWGTESDVPISVLRAPTGVSDFGQSVANVGDVDGDGTDDLLIGAFDSGDPSIAAADAGNFQLLGRRDGSFDGSQLRLIRNVSTLWWHRNQRWVGDLNGDGSDDVVAPAFKRPDGQQYYNTTNYILQVRYGGPTGLPDGAEAVTFTARPDFLPDEAWTFYLFGGVGDVNGDGYNDLLVLWHPQYTPDHELLREGELRLHYGSRVGLSLVPNWTMRLGVEEGVWWIYVHAMVHADVNGDGHSDVLFQAFTTHDPYIALHLGSTHGMSTNSIEYVKAPTNDGITTYHTDFLPPVDLDGDEYGDLVLLEYANDNDSQASVRTFRTVRGGGGSPPEVRQTVVMYEARGTTFLFAAGEHNGDGRYDILTVDSTIIPSDPNRPSLAKQYLDLLVRIHFNMEGVFDKWSNWNIKLGHLYGINRLRGVDTGDFDGDGLDDLAIGVTGLRSNCSVIIVLGRDILDAVPAIGLDAGPRLFAGHRSYDFWVNTNPGFIHRHPDVMTFRLDPEGANVTLECGLKLGGTYFREVMDPEHLVLLDSGPGDVAYDTFNRTAWARFRIWFNWTWPHERPSACSIESRWDEGLEMATLRRDVFWVENDLAFYGEVVAQSDRMGVLDEGDWVPGGDHVRIQGPRVVYEGTEDVYPPSGICDVALVDDDGTMSSTPHRVGAEITLYLDVDDTTDLKESLNLTLIDLPGLAELVSDRAFPIRIDADAPVFLRTVPDNDDWHSTHGVWMSVTVDDSPTSGMDLGGIRYAWSTNGTGNYSMRTGEGLSFHREGTALEAQLVLEFPNGEDNYLVWLAYDRVGNLNSSEMRLRVDTRNVTFTDPVPEEGSWQSSLDLTCGVTISDIEGSGIDVSSVQYRVSPRNLSQYGDWTDWDEGGMPDARTVVARALVGFALGTLNFVQWRAMDIAGNGYTSSPHYRVRIDITPISFSEFGPPASVFQTKSVVECTCVVADDPLGSGVDLATIEVRHTMANGSISQWKGLGFDGTSPSMTFQQEVQLPDGLDNKVQFRGRDVAGNGPTESTVYILLVDTTPPEISVMEPVEGWLMSDLEVSYRIEIIDATSGVNASSVSRGYWSGTASASARWGPIEVEKDQEPFVGIGMIAFEERGNGTFEFNASDLAGNVAIERVGFSINRLPVGVISSPDASGMYVESSKVPLDAEGSSDPEGGELTFTWYLEGSDEPVATGRRVDVALPAGAYNLSLTVEDPLGARSETTVSFTVGPVPRPSPPGESTFWSWPCIAAIVIALTAGLAIAYTFRERMVRGTGR